MYNTGDISHKKNPRNLTHPKFAHFYFPNHLVEFIIPQCLNTKIQRRSVAHTSDVELFDDGADLQILCQWSESQTSNVVACRNKIIFWNRSCKCMNKPQQSNNVINNLIMKFSNIRLIHWKLIIKNVHRTVWMGKRQNVPRPLISHFSIFWKNCLFVPQIQVHFILFL